MVLKNASQVLSCWPYAHDSFEDDIFIENAQNGDEVVERMVDPKDTRFKAMSWDEQAIVSKQSTQEVLRAREERIESKSVEVVEAPWKATETAEIS
jgi:hypothetical protein